MIDFVAHRRTKLGDTAFWLGLTIKVLKADGWWPELGEKENLEYLEEWFAPIRSEGISDRSLRFSDYRSLAFALRKESGALKADEVRDIVREQDAFFQEFRDCYRKKAIPRQEVLKALGLLTEALQSMSEAWQQTGNYYLVA